MSLEHCGAARTVGRFVEPPWSANLDPELELQSIPEHAKISGMFIAPLLSELKRANISVPTSRARYVPFQFYPLREHAQLLVATSRRVFHDVPLRIALRKLGRAAPTAFSASTLGKVVLGSSHGVHEVVEALAKGYALNLRPGSATIIDSLPNRIVVGFEDIHYFLDSHHVGAFEGALKHAGVRGRVLIAVSSASSAELLIEW